MLKVSNNLRYLNWFLSAYLKKYAAFIVLGFAAGLILSFLVSLLPAVSPSQFAAKENIVGIIGQYSLSNLPLSIQKELSLGLTSIDKNDRATPSAASSWEIKNNGQSYIFHLKKNLYWTDGSKFKSFDINLRLKDVQILALGDYDVQFRLGQPYAGLPSAVAQPLFKNGLVGLGPYRVTKMTRNGKFITGLEMKNINTGESTHYKFYSNRDEAVLALKLHEINILKGLNSLDGLNNWPLLQIDKTTDYHKFVALFFNMRKEPFKDKDTRLGLTYALPDVFNSDEPAFGPIAKNSWAYNPQLKTFNYSADLANKYLKPLLDKSSTSSAEFSLKLTSMKAYLPIAQSIAKNWQNLGIKVQIIPSDSIADNFDVFLAAVETMPDPDQYSLWHSTQEGNISGLNSPRIDKLLEDGRTLVNVSERKQKYLDFQKYLVEEDPAAFLFYPAGFTVTRL
ncbi:MAG: ABC transporter substrate-binding protein [Patescibacteria group bacterium]|nr:ABC transporter substrate-binding protein [Patescibacteria group bacterium]